MTFNDETNTLMIRLEHLSKATIFANQIPEAFLTKKETAKIISNMSIEAALIKERLKALVEHAL